MGNRIVTQEEKDLLLRDISGRLPYGLIIEHNGNLSKLDTIFICDNISVSSTSMDSEIFYNLNLDEFKPYLFPMSSMTEEQYELLRESGILSNCSHSYEYVNPHIHGVSFIFKEFKTYSLELIEWLNKNHFDYRGLIEKGLAIDCTNLNIY